MRLIAAVVVAAAALADVAPNATATPSREIEDGFINIFVAVDKPKYLAELAASMRNAYSVSNEARGGRPYRWFVLHQAPMDATRICDAAFLAHESRAEARVEWTGCQNFGQARYPTACSRDVTKLGEKKTVNVLRLGAPPPILDTIYKLTEKAFKIKNQCHSRPDLVSFMNFAPDAVDQFLLPLGVRRVVVLDADASPGSDLFVKLYDADADPTKIVSAISRAVSKCGNVWEEFNYKNPVVRATLGKDVAAANQRRFRASCYKIKDLAQYCERGVAERIADMLRLQNGLPLPSDARRLGARPKGRRRRHRWEMAQQEKRKQEYERKEREYLRKEREYETAKLAFEQALAGGGAATDKPADGWTAALTGLLVGMAKPKPPPRPQIIVRPAPPHRLDAHQRLWACGLQQPPLILGMANHTELLRYHDLRLVGSPGVQACDAFDEHHRPDAHKVVYATCTLKSLPVAPTSPEILDYLLGQFSTGRAWDNYSAHYVAQHNGCHDGGGG